MIVASAAEIEIADLGRIGASSTIVSKPVHRDALYEALSAAMGEPLLGGVKAARAAPTEPLIGGHVLLVEDEPVNAAVAEGYLVRIGMHLLSGSRRVRRRLRVAPPSASI